MLLFKSVLYFNIQCVVDYIRQNRTCKIIYNCNALPKSITYYIQTNADKFLGFVLVWAHLIPNSGTVAAVYPKALNSAVIFILAFSINLSENFFSSSTNQIPLPGAMLF